MTIFHICNPFSHFRCSQIRLTRKKTLLLQFAVYLGILTNVCMLCVYTARMHTSARELVHAHLYNVCVCVSVCISYYNIEDPKLTSFGLDLFPSMGEV